MKKYSPDAVIGQIKAKGLKFKRVSARKHYITTLIEGCIFKTNE